MPIQFQLTVQASASEVATPYLCATPGGKLFGTSNVGWINCKHFDTDSTSIWGVKLDRLVASSSILLQSKWENYSNAAWKKNTTPNNGANRNWSKIFTKSQHTIQLEPLPNNHSYQPIWRSVWIMILSTSSIVWTIEFFPSKLVNWPIKKQRTEKKSYQTNILLCYWMRCQFDSSVEWWVWGEFFLDLWWVSEFMVIFREWWVSLEF